MAFVRGRSDECALDCASRAAGPFGEVCSHRAVDRARRRRCLYRCRCLDVVIFDAVMSRPLKPVWIPVAAAVSGTQD